jgi:parallel beta-helix repeat protein
MTNNYYGVQLELPSNNSIVGNNITNNVCSLVLWSSSGNRFYHNNAEQVSAFDSVNIWDDGYPIGGNYWSNFADADLYCGPSQDVPSNDGVWDHPYVIDSYNKDSYPLVKPYVPSNLSVSISTDKATYHAGEKMRLGLNVSNPDSVKYLCFAIWVTLPDNSIYVYMHKHSVVLPIGFDYANPFYQTITLPNLPPGKYTWHAAFLNRTTHTITVEDTTEWQFS